MSWRDTTLRTDFHIDEGLAQPPTDASISNAT